MAALLLLLLWTRVGIHAVMRGRVLTVDAKIGWFRIRILPGKQKDSPKDSQRKKEKTSKKEKKLTAQTTKEKPKKKSKITFADIKDAVKTLWPPLKRALDRTRRGIRIHPLTVSLTVGAANDPAGGAELYGYLHAGVWTAMPLLERLLVIPDPSIHIGIDFDAPDTSVEGEVWLSARIGTLLRVALTIGIPALRFILQWRKRTKQPPAPQTAEQQAAG